MASARMDYRFRPVDTSEDKLDPEDIAEHLQLEPGLQFEGRNLELSTRLINWRTTLVTLGLVILVGVCLQLRARPSLFGTKPVLDLLGSTYNENVAVVYLQYARAAVCGHAELESWDCGEMCDIAPADPAAVRFLRPGRKHEVQGFVAALPAAYNYDESSARPGRHCIIAFRGTVNMKNWEADFEDALNKEWPPGGASWCTKCEVGTGNADAYKELRPQIFSAVEELGCSDASLTGHSLGGAMAMLTAFELRALKGFRASPVYTFGSPRLGTEAFVAAFEHVSELRGVSPPAWRVVHFKDPVPRFGSFDFKGRHVPREVYYTEAQDSYRICSPVDGDDPTCSSQIPWYSCVEEVTNHLNYLNSTRHITCKHTGVDPWKTHGRLY